MKFIDLFAGIGGIKIGLEQAGGFECVFSNDFDEKAKLTFDANISNQEKKLVLKDIKQIKTDEIPSCDILTAGFPCQPFSIAGYREGFNDRKNRGNLFFEIVRILKIKKPKVILLENVKNLKTHNKGDTIKIIYQELQNLGYKLIDKVLNTMEYANIPQNRERIYIVGFLNERVLNRFIFPNKTPLTTTIFECLESKKIDNKYYYNGKLLHQKIKNDIVRRDTIYQWRRKYVRENKKGVCPTLTANMGTGGHNVPIIIDNLGIRKITPRECANFQGFPKSYMLPDIPDSYLYKQFGNSVSVPIFKRLGINIRKALLK